MGNNTWIDFVGLALAFVAAMGVVLIWQNSIFNRWNAQIASSTYRQKLFDRYENQGAEGYYTTLGRLLWWGNVAGIAKASVIWFPPFVVLMWLVIQTMQA